MACGSWQDVYIYIYIYRAATTRPNSESLSLSLSVSHLPPLHLCTYSPVHYCTLTSCAQRSFDFLPHFSCSFLFHRLLHFRILHVVYLYLLTASTSPSTDYLKAHSDAQLHIHTSVENCFKLFDHQSLYIYIYMYNP